MTKVDDILNELRKGTSLTDIRKDPNFRSQTQITEATQLYLSEAGQEVSEKQKMLLILRSQIVSLQTKIDASENESQQLDKTIGDAEKKSNMLHQELSKLTKEKETRQNEIDSISTEINELSKKGITLGLLTQVHNLEVETGEALLERVKTSSNLVGVRRDIAKLSNERKNLEKKIEDLERKLKDLISDVQSQRNILDEAQRRNQAFSNAVEVVSSFLSDGYTTLDLQHLRKGLNIFQIKGKQELSINRLVSGLEDAKTLIGLTDQIEEKRSELETLEGNISAAKGELRSYSDTVVKLLKDTREKGIAEIKDAKQTALNEINELNKATKSEILSVGYTAKNEIASTSNVATRTLVNFEAKVNSIVKVLDDRTGSAVKFLNDNVYLITKQFRNDLVVSTDEFRKIIRDYEAFLDKFNKIKSEASRFEYELNQIRLVNAFIAYPSEAKNVPYEHILNLQDALVRHYIAKGINPKIKVGDALYRKYGPMYSSTEVELLDLVTWIRSGLQIRGVGK